MTAESPERDGVVLAQRPAPGTPRPYDFPEVTRTQLDNGLTVMIADLPGPAAGQCLDLDPDRRVG